MIYVIHHRDKPDYERRMPLVYVGRGSPLGNPYKIGEFGTRAEAIAKYSTWLDYQITIDPVVEDELRRIEALDNAGDVALVCWCAPKRCHAEVIRDVINGFRLHRESPAGIETVRGKHVRF